jgi:hypothetical protein
VELASSQNLPFLHQRISKTLPHLGPGRRRRGPFDLVSAALQFDFFGLLLEKLALQRIVREPWSVLSRPSLTDIRVIEDMRYLSAKYKEGYRGFEEMKPES